MTEISQEGPGRAHAGQPAPLPLGSTGAPAATMTYRRAQKLQAIRELDRKIEIVKQKLSLLVNQRGRIKMSLHKIDEFANNPERVKNLIKARGQHPQALPKMTKKQYGIYRYWRYEYGMPREQALIEALR